MNAKTPTAKTRLLDAAVKFIRLQGYAATTVDELCAEAGVTKGAFFHHFKTKDELGAAAAQRWTDMTAPFFQAAPYHEPSTALERVLAYIDFRREMIGGKLADFTCLAGTLAQEVHTSHPEMARAAGQAITGHAETLIDNIQTAMDESGRTFDFSAESLALHTQVALQGGFILAKATGDAELAKDSMRHLRRYVELLFELPHEGRRNAMTNSIRTCLWFEDGRGSEAAEFYCSLIPGSRVERVFTGDNGMGTFSVIDFTLGGLPYQILDAGPYFKQTEAVSISVETPDQAESDRLWYALTADGGAESMCGWLKDKYGVSWQVFPKRLTELTTHADKSVSGRAMAAMMKQKKIDMEAIEAAVREAA
jgi:predicted 3-demethylubiquinone-9 3-methyltransferase (glyoxalase superfamily)/AcrR family transcriptional regulator